MDFFSRKKVFFNAIYNGEKNGQTKKDLNLLHTTCWGNNKDEEEKKEKDIDYFQSFS